jgi:hypothetical protein
LAPGLAVRKLLVASIAVGAEPGGVLPWFQLGPTQIGEAMFWSPWPHSW